MNTYNLFVVIPDYHSDTAITELLQNKIDPNVKIGQRTLTRKDKAGYTFTATFASLIGDHCAMHDQIAKLLRLHDIEYLGLILGS